MTDIKASLVMPVGILNPSLTCGPKHPFIMTGGVALGEIAELTAYLTNGLRVAPMVIGGG